MRTIEKKPGGEVKRTTDGMSGSGRKRECDVKSAGRKARAKVKGKKRETKKKLFAAREGNEHRNSAFGYVTLQSCNKRSRSDP